MLDEPRRCSIGAPSKTWFDDRAALLPPGARGERSGKALEHLRAAREWLSCDRLDIRIGEADKSLQSRYPIIARGEKPAADAFVKLTGPLGRALDAALDLLREDVRGVP
jgi:hypothetical protein